MLGAPVDTSRQADLGLMLAWMCQHWEFAVRDCLWVELSGGKTHQRAHSSTMAVLNQSKARGGKVHFVPAQAL